jgi:hypothetical protein
MSLATLFCLAGGMVGWTEVLPDLAFDGEVNADFYFLAGFIVVVSWTLLQVNAQITPAPHISAFYPPLFTLKVVLLA